MEEMRDKLLEMFPDLLYMWDDEGRISFISYKRDCFVIVNCAGYFDMFAKLTWIYKVHIISRKGAHTIAGSPSYSKGIFWDFDYIVGFIKENLPKLSDNSDNSAQNTPKSHENGLECVS